MSVNLIEWDKSGEKQYQTGIDRVALYHLYEVTNTATSAVSKQFRLVAAWNGVSALNESPSGAESNKIYADNLEYLNLISNEELSVTLEAYTSPEKFDECDGMANLSGLKIHGVSRRPFALAYRVLKGNDENEANGENYGYEYHLLYNCKAGVASRDNATVNDSPEAGTFSWEISTEKVEVDGMSPTSHVIIDIAALRDGVLVNGTTKTAATTGTGNISSIKSAVEALLYDKDTDSSATFKDIYADATVTDVYKGKCPLPDELDDDSTLTVAYNT